MDPRVHEVFVYYLQTAQGNPSSIHQEGQQARGLLTQARREIANYLGCRSSEIFFTSGATEGLNIIMRGIFGLNPRGHLITSSIEHASVYSTAKSLEDAGCSVTFLNPENSGEINPKALQAALQPDTRLIALMAVNNETGVKTDIHAIAAIAHEAKIPFLVDGVGLMGKASFEIPDGVSAMCFSGHKFHAPKGCGFCFVRSNLKLHSVLTGGAQEFGKRSGTENLPAIMAMLEAIHILYKELPNASTRMEHLRNKLEQELLDRLQGVTINGKDSQRIVNTSNLSFDDVEGESLLTLLDMAGIAVSHGSACASGALEPSRVLLNMGLPREKASSAIRLSLSRFTNESEIDRTIEAIYSIVNKLRYR
jgi:cysteine desulfurase